VAVLLAATSVGGILLPSTYARETASWRAQGIGQDWFDLLVVVPVLVTGAIRLRRGSRAARIVVGGALIYSAYSFVLSRLRRALQRAVPRLLRGSRIVGLFGGRPAGHRVP
jgi:hypothetical protein